VMCKDFIKSVLGACRTMPFRSLRLPAPLNRYRRKNNARR